MSTASSDAQPRSMICGNKVRRVSASQVAIGDRSPSPIGTSQNRIGVPRPAWQKQSTSLPGTSGFGNRDRRALISQSFACFQSGTSGNVAKSSASSISWKATTPPGFTSRADARINDGTSSWKIRTYLPITTSNDAASEVSSGDATRKWTFFAAAARARAARIAASLRSIPMTALTHPRVQRQAVRRLPPRSQRRGFSSREILLSPGANASLSAGGSPPGCRADEFR